jgi:hypothetical protein
LDPDVCREIGASDYVWNYIGSDGTSREACTQSCGGKPLKVSICMDEFTSNITYINKTFDDNWVGIDINKKGQCFCKKGFYKATNGLCVKSKN